MTYFEMIQNKKPCTVFVRNDFNTEDIEKINNGTNIYVVYAHDKFLSGWGEAENKRAYQCVICFDRETAVNVFESFKNDRSFKRPYFETVESFTLCKRFNKDALLCVKNGNHCPAWNGKKEG